MHRFVLTLCLVLATFDLRIDAAQACVCVQIRNLPEASAGWCMRASAPAPWVVGVAARISRGRG